MFPTRCCAVKITVFNLLGFFPRTGFSRFFISCINAAKQRNKPALFMASYRAGPGGMLRAISIARSTFASQCVFESEFVLVKKRPHIVTRPPIDLGKSFRSGSSSRRNLCHCLNSLVSLPIPSIATVTLLTGSFIDPTPSDVPQQIRSPGNNVISCEILLTSCCALKIMSEIG